MARNAFCMRAVGAVFVEKATAQVVPHAPGARFSEPVTPARLERPYVLAVGTLTVHST